MKTGDTKYTGPRSGSSSRGGEKLKQALIIISEICKKYHNEPNPCDDCPLLVHCDLDSTCVFCAFSPASVPNELFFTDYEVKNQEAKKC